MKGNYALYDVRDSVNTFFANSYEKNITSDYVNNDWKLNKNIPQTIHQPISPHPVPPPNKKIRINKNSDKIVKNNPYPSSRNNLIFI